MSTTNPFEKQLARTERGEGNALVQTESDRSVAEIQSQMVIAKRFPRDEWGCVEKIKKACARPALAECATYSYPRGDARVTGPSIRLAEAIAQAWGNMEFGIRELEQKNGASLVEAYAWDFENNTRQRKIFSVPHIRQTRQGATILKDPRDIYELIANQGARRMRACILGLIPGDVIDVAVEQCEQTVKNSGLAPAERLKGLLAKFAELGVTGDMIQKRLGHNLEACVIAEILQLGKIYNSIRDGFGKPADYFDIEREPEPKLDATGQISKADSLVKRIRGRKVIEPEPTPEMPRPALGVDQNTGEVMEGATTLQGSDENALNRAIGLDSDNDADDFF